MQLLNSWWWSHYANLFGRTVDYAQGYGRCWPHLRACPNGFGTQHPPVSCEKCQSCYNACGEGQHPLVSNLRNSVELGLAIVRYSGLSKSLYHASGEALEGWLSRILALLELSWPAPHPLLETGKARVDINRQALWFLKARFQYLSILFLLDEVLWMSLVPSKLGCRPVDRLPSCVAALKMWPEARGWNWFMVHCFAVLQNDTWTRNPTDCKHKLCHVKILSLLCCRGHSVLSSEECSYPELGRQMLRGRGLWKTKVLWMEVDSKFFSLKAWKAQRKLFASLDKEQSQSRRLHLDYAELCGYIPEPPRMTQDLISTGEHTQFNFWTVPFDSAFSALGFYLLALYSAPPCICMLSCWECESQSPALTVLVSNVSFPTVQRNNIPLPTLMIFDVLRHVFGQKGLAAAICSASLQGQLWELCHLSDTYVTHRWVTSESQVTYS